MKKSDFIFWDEMLMGFVVGLLVLVFIVPLRLLVKAFNYITELGMITIDDYKRDLQRRRESRKI